MSTAIVNPGQRTATVFTKNVAYNTPGIASAIAIGIIPAGSIIVPSLTGIFVTTVFNAGATNVLTLGTSTTATELLGAGAVTEGTKGAYFVAEGASGIAGDVLVVTAETTIYVKFTESGTAATTGAATVMVGFIGLYARMVG